jgi:uncharacterized protein (DUF111 family)
VGTLEGIHRLDIGAVHSSALRLGRGSVHSEHGVIPIPAPATTLLLRGAKVELPEIDAELVTPTGAALIASLVDGWGPPPPFTLETIGTGAGGRDLEQHANVLRVLIGKASVSSLSRRRVAVLETAIDDDNPQFVAALMPRLLEVGALDAMLVPSVMKKGRPGLWLVAIADPERAETLAHAILKETSTLGVRVRIDERFELERRSAEVETRFGRIEVKVAELPGGGARVSPEFESVRAAAARARCSLREVAEAAVAAWGQGAGRHG